MPNDVVAIYNMEFVKLPWQQLMPNMHVMESMAMVGFFFLCLLGSFRAFSCVSADFFFKINVFRKFFQECHRSVKQLGPRSVGPDLGPNHLQRFSADDKSHC